MSREQAHTTHVDIHASLLHLKGRNTLTSLLPLQRGLDLRSPIVKPRQPEPVRPEPYRTNQDGSPLLITLKKGVDSKESMLYRLPADTRVKDNYSFWLNELYDLDHKRPSPVEGKDAQSRYEAEKQAFLQERNTHDDGIWVYAPWRREVVHIPSQAEFTRLVQVRNFPAISKDDQEKISHKTIAIAGGSVGSHMADVFTRLGVGELRIADMDTISPTNLNRLYAAGIFDVGEEKAVTLPQKLWEINPFLKIVTYKDGVTHQNAKAFVSGADLVIDAIDGIARKIELRELGTELGIPVLMGTDLSFAVPVHLSRPGDKVFQGRLAKLETEIIKLKDKRGDRLTLPETIKAVIDILGIENIPARMANNFSLMLQGEAAGFTQPIITCLMTAGLTGYYAYELLRGNGDRLKTLHIIDLEHALDKQTTGSRRNPLSRIRNHFSPPEKRDDKKARKALLTLLKTQHPEVFKKIPDTTARRAA